MTKKDEKIKNKFRSFFSFRNMIIFGTLTIFISVILFMQIGESIATEYDKAVRPVKLEENPKSFDLPNQNANSSIGGFNITQDFQELPGFNVPGDLASTLPESFGSGTYGGLPDVSKVIDDPLGNGRNGISGNPINLPTIDNPNLPNSDGNPIVTNPGNPPIIDNSNSFIPSNSSGSANPKNASIGTRIDKARNLPKLDFIDLQFVNFNFLSIYSQPLQIATTSLIFMTLLFLPLIVDNKIIPKILRIAEDYEVNISSENTIFFSPKRDLDSLRRKKDRIRKLLLFKDHVDELVVRSKDRLKLETPNLVIVTGYHELDSAFAEFSQLIRTPSITPLEHSHMDFETGEIENNILEKIVELFYLARYGNRELILEDAKQFIKLLIDLVIDKSEITDRLHKLDQEISDYNVGNTK